MNLVRKRRRVQEGILGRQRGRALGHELCRQRPCPLRRAFREWYNEKEFVLSSATARVCACRFVAYTFLRNNLDATNEFVQSTASLRPRRNASANEGPSPRFRHTAP